MSLEQSCSVKTPAAARELTEQFLRAGLSLLAPPRVSQLRPDTNNEVVDVAVDQPGPPPLHQDVPGPGAVD